LEKAFQPTFCCVTGLSPAIVISLNQACAALPNKILPRMVKENTYKTQGFTAKKGALSLF
jgi:hypothetical protein